jgi:DNA-binding transcriptional LysR family regulator
MSTIDFRLIRQLWMFLAVAEEQHFGRAAKRLGMSQPPLTEQIKVLEHSLKLQLFERSRRGTKLSVSGAALLPAILRFSDQVEHLEKIVREVAAGQTGVLQIGAITLAMLDTVPPILTRLRSDYPNATVLVREIDSVEAVPGLESGELDVAFVRLEGKIGGSIATMPLSQSKLAVALPAGHRLASQKRVGLRSLETESFVMSARRISPVYFDMLVGVCRSNGFTPRILHEVRSVMTQVAYVGCNQGIALVPESMRKLASKSVVIRPLTEDVTVVTAAAAWNKDRHNPLVDALLAIINESRNESGGRVQMKTA